MDVTTSFGLVPKARLGNIIADPAIGALASGVFYALVQGAGLLLLLWLTASRLTREHFPAVPRHAVSDILTLGVAFAFLPAVAQLTTAFGYEAFDTVRASLALSPTVRSPGGAERPGRMAADDRARPRLCAGGVVVQAAHASAVGPCLCGGGPGGCHVARAVDPGADRHADHRAPGCAAQDVPSLAAWAMGSIVLFATLVFTWQRLGPLGSTAAFRP